MTYRFGPATLSTVTPTIEATLPPIAGKTTAREATSVELNPECSAGRTAPFSMWLLVLWVVLPGRPLVRTATLGKR
jgi:hypothetical protein